MKIFIAIVFILFFVRLYVCRKKRNINANLTEKEKEKKCIELLQNILRQALSEEERSKLLKKNQEEDFIGLLKHLTHQELLFLCLDSDEPICFNFSLEESSDGPLFVFSLNSKKQSINIREEMKKVTFKENGSIVYGQELIKTVREAISDVNKEN